MNDEYPQREHITLASLDRYPLQHTNQDQEHLTQMGFQVWRFQQQRRRIARVYLRLRKHDARKARPHRWRLNQTCRLLVEALEVLA